jgi:hypothetical protein
MLVYVLLAAALARPAPGSATPSRSTASTTEMRAARTGPPPLTRGLRCAHVTVHRLAVDATSRAPTTNHVAAER